MLSRLIREILTGRGARKPGSLDAAAASTESGVLGIPLRCPAFATAPEAVEWIQAEVLPRLEACVEQGRHREAEQIEGLTYDGAVKRFEQPAHYDRCLSLMHPPLHALGRQRAAGTVPPPEDWSPRRLVFFVHNIAANLAHNELLCNVLGAYLGDDGARADSLRVVGIGNSLADCYRPLIAEHGLRVESYNNATFYEVLQRLAAELRQQDDVRLIVVAVPVGLSYLCGLIDPARLGWLSMKFEVAALPTELPRYAFTSSRRRSKRVGNALWRTAPPLLTHLGEELWADTPTLALAGELQRFRCVLYTINREAKIKQSAYLDVVARLLKANPDACFVWTGREQLPEVVASFAAHGVLDRTFFAGWVEPDSLLRLGHIFLDTPTLSGMVAARAVTLGLPVVTFTESHSWVNFFAEEMNAPELGQRAPELAMVWEVCRAQGLVLECVTAVDYMELVQRLIDSEALRTHYGRLLQLFGRHFFANRAAHAAMHFENFHAPASAP